MVLARVHRPRRRSVALLALLAVATGSLGAPGASQAAVSEPRPAHHVGSAGIGDAYFPRDGNGGYDVAHYSVRDSYDQASDRLVGSTVLEATATQTLTRFDLDLMLDVASVSVDGEPATYTVMGGHELVVTPTRTLAAGQVFRVRVQYAGRPASLSYLGESNWLSDARESVAMNQPHMASWWFAANDHPLDKAGFDIRITARSDRQVIANGTLVRRARHDDGTTTTHWRSPEPMATYLAFFALGRYEVRSGTTDGLPWVAAVSRELPRAARRAAMTGMLRSPEIVHWLETQVGPYPFASTGGLTTSLSPGFALENQTRPVYPVLGSDRLTTIVHELSHQWFGDSVSVSGWRDIWLNEGLATFFEVRYDETHGGSDAQAWLEKQYAARAGDAAFWTVQVDDPGARRIFDTPVYLRGAMAAQALRTRIGDPSFFTLLRTWVAQKRGGNGSSAQFEALAGQVGGVDLTSFFDSWLRSPVPPAHTAGNGFVV